MRSVPERAPTPGLGDLSIPRKGRLDGSSWLRARTLGQDKMITRRRERTKRGGRPEKRASWGRQAWAEGSPPEENSSGLWAPAPSVGADWPEGASLAGLGLSDARDRVGGQGKDTQGTGKQSLRDLAPSPLRLTVSTPRAKASWGSLSKLTSLGLVRPFSALVNTWALPTDRLRPPSRPRSRETPDGNCSARLSPGGPANPDLWPVYESPDLGPGGHELGRRIAGERPAVSRVAVLCCVSSN